YHYFADKQDLVREVIAHQVELVLDVQRQFPLDSLKSLRTWRDAVIALQDRRECQGGCVLGTLATELADGDEAARAALAAGYTEWEQRIRDGLVAMRERGALRQAADVERLAVVP